MSRVHFPAFHFLLAAVLLVAAFYAGRLTVPKEIGPRLPDSAPSVESGVRSDESASVSESGSVLKGQTNSALLEIQETLSRIGGRPTSRRQTDELLEKLLLWSQMDPKAAADYARRELRPPILDEAIGKLLSSWAQRDPAAAWTWASTEMADNFVSIDAVLSEVAKTLPEVAWHYATGFALVRPGDAAGAYVAAMKGMMHVGKFRDLTRLIDGAVLTPESASSEHGLHDLLASTWARYAPQDSAAWVQALDRETRAYHQALAGLGDSWALEDPEAAADFALQLPAMPERQRILRTAADEWAIANPDRAAEWLDRYVGHANYDSLVAVVATAERNMDANFTQSIGWAGRISDDALRLDSLTRIVERWATRDTDEAKRFLAYSPELSPMVRQEIAKRLKSVGTLSD